MNGKGSALAGLLGLLALISILTVTNQVQPVYASAFGYITAEIDMSKGAGSSATADCVAAKNCFTPNPLTVAPGTTVTWKNTDTVSHYVTSGVPTDNTTGTVFDSGNLIKPGGTYQFAFANEGTFDYFCTVHPWMTAQVIVSASATSGNQTGGTTNSTVPEFGPVASIVLAIAITSIVVFAAKTRVIPKL